MSDAVNRALLAMLAQAQTAGEDDTRTGEDAVDKANERAQPDRAAAECRERVLDHCTVRVEALEGEQARLRRAMAAGGFDPDPDRPIPPGELAAARARLARLEATNAALLQLIGLTLMRDASGAVALRTKNDIAMSLPRAREREIRHLLKVAEVNLD
jgi:hypothetical protein